MSKEYERRRKDPGAFYGEYVTTDPKVRGAYTTGYRTASCEGFKDFEEFPWLKGHDELRQPFEDGYENGQREYLDNELSQIYYEDFIH